MLHIHFNPFLAFQVIFSSCKFSGFSTNEMGCQKKMSSLSLLTTATLSTNCVTLIRSHILWHLIFAVFLRDLGLTKKRKNISKCKISHPNTIKNIVFLPFLQWSFYIINYFVSQCDWKWVSICQMMFMINDWTPLFKTLLGKQAKLCTLVVDMCFGLLTI